MWSLLESDLEGRRRAAELASLDDFFKPAIERGARMMHHTPDIVESAHRILRQILKNAPIALLIQEELVDQSKTITETSAGIAVDEKLAQLTQTYERKLREQWEAAEEARCEADEETRKEMIEEARRFRQLLEKVQEDKRNQMAQYQLLQQRFAEAEWKREQAIAEEKSQRAWAAEAKRLKGVGAPARRVVKMEEKIMGKVIPNPIARDGVIVSGRLYNLKYGPYYATLHENKEDREYLPPKLFMRSLTKENAQLSWNGNWLDNSELVSR
jgi:paraquat-inducible protein B